MSDKIEIKIDGPKLTPDKFVKATDAFFSLLQGVAYNISKDSKSEDWIVEVESGSAVVRARSPLANKAQAIHAVTCGLMALASGVQVLPEWFTKDEVKQVRNLVSVIDDDGQFVREIIINSGGGPIALSPEILVTSDVILSGEKQIAFGSLEGIIEALHRKEGQPFTCTVNDPIHRRSVVCSFTNPEAEEIAYKAFRPQRRVLVDGLIHYAKEGHPVRIDAHIVKVFPDEKDLPILEDIHAFFKQ